MPVLPRYFILRIGGAIALLWTGLTALVAVLQLVAEADEYAPAAAALLALAQTPRLALETLPFACAIAAAASLQRMEESRELQTMRAAGLSLGRIALLAGYGGAVFAAAALLLGEAVLEPAESLARTIKNRPAAKGDVWLHHNGEFFHAEKIIPGGVMKNIAVYNLRPGALKILTAAEARRTKNAWQLENGEEFALAEGKSESRQFTAREWNFPLPAAALNAIIRRPREMSMRALASAGALRDSGAGARFAVAFWRRLASIPAPPLLAACAIWSIGMRRRITVSVLSATAIGGAYYFAALMSAQTALALNFPALSAAPILLLAAFLAYATKRRFT
ncbi:MAG: LptF/LptG family permease [Gammaproteobacteria bacterium]